MSLNHWVFSSIGALFRARLAALCQEATYQDPVPDTHLILESLSIPTLIIKQAFISHMTDKYLGYVYAHCGGSKRRK